MSASSICWCANSSSALRGVVGQSIEEYNTIRPHGSLQGITPADFADQWAMSQFSKPERLTLGLDQKSRAGHQYSPEPIGDLNNLLERVEKYRKCRVRNIGGVFRGEPLGGAGTPPKGSPGEIARPVRPPCTRTCRCREAHGCAGAAIARERVHIVARLKAVSKAPSDEPQPSAPTTPMSWIARLNRVFAIDLSTCARLVAANCGPSHTVVQVPRSTRMCECGHCRGHRARSHRTHPPTPALA